MRDVALPFALAVQASYFILQRVALSGTEGGDGTQPIMGVMFDSLDIGELD